MWSLGPFVAPAAFVLLGAAIASLWTVPPPGTHESVLDDPPSVVEAGLKTLTGVTVVMIGAGLTYEGTFIRELFTRGCSSETLACALAVTRWDAVGLSILGLVAIGIGGWLVWKQVTIRWILATNRPG